jgi:hypothetical protein
VTRDGPDRPAFPALVEQIGDDPARYLYGRRRWIALARIRGLRTFEQVEAFRAVERSLVHQYDLRSEPREWVLEALADREAVLEDRGVFDPDVPQEPPETGPYSPGQWERDAGGLPPITPHEDNIAEAVADGGEDGDQA